MKCFNFEFHFFKESVPLGSGVTLMLGNTMEHELTLDVMFTSNGSFSVVLDTSDKTKQYTIHYITTRSVFLFIFTVLNVQAPFDQGSLGG